VGVASILEWVVGFFGAGTLFALFLCAASSDAEPFLAGQDDAVRSRTP
jgi:hypothetical protein